MKHFFYIFIFFNSSLIALQEAQKGLGKHAIEVKYIQDLITKPSILSGSKVNCSNSSALYTVKKDNFPPIVSARYTQLQLNRTIELVRKHATLRDCKVILKAPVTIVPKFNEEPTVMCVGETVFNHKIRPSPCGWVACSTVLGTLAFVIQALLTNS